MQWGVNITIWPSFSSPPKLYNIYNIRPWPHSINNIVNVYMFVCLCVCTLEPFPPPDDFRLRAIILQRLWFTWTINDTYRNCTSLTNIYITNCTSTCRFSSDRISIVCSGISTAAHICLFQLQYSICDDITGNASDPVYITLKGEII